MPISFLFIISPSWSASDQLDSCQILITISHTFSYNSDPVSSVFKHLFYHHLYLCSFFRQVNISRTLFTVPFMCLHRPTQTDLCSAAIIMLPGIITLTEFTFCIVSFDSFLLIIMSFFISCTLNQLPDDLEDPDVSGECISAPPTPYTPPLSRLSCVEIVLMDVVAVNLLLKTRVLQSLLLGDCLQVNSKDRQPC